MQTPISPVSQTVLQRIRRMQEVAKDQAGTPEGEVAARLALHAMRAHAVEQADLDTAEQAISDPLEMQKIELGARSNWRRNLVGALARHWGPWGP